jgi:hypothetical protein
MNVGSREECIAKLESFKSSPQSGINFRLGDTEVSISRTPTAPVSQSFFFAVSKVGSHRSITGYCASVDVAISRLDDYLKKSAN